MELPLSVHFKIDYCVVFLEQLKISVGEELLTSLLATIILCSLTLLLQYKQSSKKRGLHAAHTPPTLTDHRTI